MKQYQDSIPIMHSMQQIDRSGESHTSAKVRYLQVILFTAVYIALGYLFKLKAQSYLLLGIPLTLIFQLLIARQPLHKLWLRDEATFSLNKRARTIACCLAIFPAYKIYQLALQGQLSAVQLGYYLAAIVGALGAGYSFSRLTKNTSRYLFLCLGISLLIRAAMYAAAFLQAKKGAHVDYVQGIASLLTYIPIAFVVEEVVFRGMLDTYVHPAGKQHGPGTALFTSALWGLWHLPITNMGGMPLWIVPLALVVRHIIFGVPFALFWRKSGNLVVPSFSHAVVDAIRDAII